MGDLNDQESIIIDHELARPAPRLARSISLFQIEAGLLELLEHRATRLADRDDPPDAEELEALEGEIQRYQFAEPRKVAGVAAIDRMWDADIATGKQELARVRLWIKEREAMRKYLRERIADALSLLPEPTGKTKSKVLVGVDGSKLILKPNGGVFPLQIDGWDAEEERWLVDSTVLPAELETALVRMPLDWFLTLSGQYCDVVDLKLVSHAPDNTRIRAALAEVCPACEGACSIMVYDESATMERGGTVKQACGTCDGTGKRIVPGARLTDRKSHVEIK